MRFTPYYPGKLIPAALLLAVIFILFAQNADAKVCSVTSTTSCTADADCSSLSPAGQTCVAEMKDYCINPPLIGVPTKPNLLFMFDNSASMQDLNYVDKGTATRTPTYCFDNTYRSAPTTTYVGYFKTKIYYDYDFAADHFFETALSSIPADGACAQTLQKINNTLFVCYDGATRSVNRFVAVGNYLNWLTMSKFDVQKQILTGGKYDEGSHILKAETRGCVGRTFIKQPITADYIEGGTNTPLGITFGISGPPDPYNLSAPSPAGQTWINIYIGAYNEADCQQVITDFANPSIKKEDLIKDIELCISYSATNKNTCQYDSSIICSTDANCGYSSVAGTCGAVVANGTCGPLSGGICSSTPGGICTHNDGTCPATTGNKGSCIKSNGTVNCTNCCNSDANCTGSNNGTCTRKCVGGAKEGTVCGTNASSNNAVCLSSSCTAGDKSKTSCVIDSDCNLKNCSNAGPKNGQPCTTNSGCDSGKCTAGQPATTDCLTHADCNSATAFCTSGKPNTTPCAVNADCNLTVVGNGQCLPPASVQLKSTYGQTMHTCYQLLFKGQTLTAADLNTVSGNNGCNSIYKAYYACKSGDNDGLACTGAADCPSGTCERGPNAIRPGSPVLVCGSDYAGYCASSTCTGGANSGMICRSDAECPGGTCWGTTTWNPMGYTTADDCVTAAITAYCNASQVADVIDPTENASSTANFANLPAILSGVGLEGQLGQPVAQLPVNVYQTDTPTGLVQQFGDIIRMGAMIFNPYGTPSECTTTYPPPVNTVPCPKICSSDPTRLCGASNDCPFPATAQCTTVATYPGTRSCYTPDQNPVLPVVSCSSDGDCGIGESCLPGNSDAAKIVYYVGYGYCYDKTTDPMTQIFPAVRCTNDAHCAANQTCKSDLVESHSTGLLYAIDSIKGASWTPFAEGFYDAIGYFGKMPSNLSNTNLRINPSDYKANMNPSQVVCQKNNILLVTDGMSTADLNASVNTFASLYTSGTPGVNGPLTGSSCGDGTNAPYKGSINLDNLAWAAKNRKISALVSNASITTTPMKPNESITTYVVLNGESNGLAGECNSETMLSNTALNGGTTLKKAENSQELKDKLSEALWSIAAGAVSGTAASVLASGEGSGANLIQAVFYPTKKFVNTDPVSGATSYDEITWTGRLTNLWFYVDPFLNQSSIREDDGDKYLNLKTATSLTGAGSKDFVSKMHFDSTTETVLVSRFTDTNGDGTPDSAVLPDITIENIPNLWEAGTLLWKRDLATDPRTIYTSTTGTSLMAFSTANAAALTSYLTATSNTHASNIISYITGSDISGYRSRTVKVDLNGDGDTLDAGETTARVWKLGDILNSTPKISSWLPLNTYNKVYGDGTYGIPYHDAGSADPVDASHYTTTSLYKGRGMVFVGGNDGMLHAFKLGKLELNWSGQQTTQVARLTGADLGKEMWAFIPMNELPYLKYQTATGYCHLYSVDLTPYIFDASIGSLVSDESTTTRTVSSWRTILIGGMRYGGACRNSTTTCTDVEGDGIKDCVNTPTPGLGYSSYFALDITDQNNPTLLWEYANEDLGFSTSGPVVIRLKARDMSNAELPNANGKWFVVLASGSTGPINTTDRQFMGHSDQNLKLFVLDLKSGALLQTIDTGIANAFAGNMLGTALDADLDYQDDAVYIPFVKKSSAGPLWNAGGVGRLMTKENPDTTQWVFGQVTTDDIGPVTATVSKLVDTKSNAIWLYFGTGRYFYEKSGSGDDAPGQRHIIGLKDPCANASGFDSSCTTQLSLANLTDVTTTLIATPPANGWYIRLDPAGSYGPYGTDPLRPYNAERDVTDPAASTRGFAFFTTFKPYDDECALTGRTFIWCTKFDTGGVCVNLTGTIVIQLSTGQITQVPPTFPEAGGRKTDVGPGAPPGPGGGTIAPRSAVNKTVHIKER